MTEETKTNFASDSAGEYWAEVKAERGDSISIADVTGTGADGGIKKSDIQLYLKEIDAQADAQEPKPDVEPVEQNVDIEEAIEAAPKPDQTPKVEGNTLVNLTDSVHIVEGVKIYPKGKTALTDDLKGSKRVAYAVKLGLLEIK